MNKLEQRSTRKSKKRENKGFPYKRMKNFTKRKISSTNP